MAKRQYEGFYIIKPEDVIRNQAKSHFQEVLSSHGGKVTREDDLGVKDLPYLMRKNSKGFYILYNFEIDPAKVDAFKKEIHLDENLLKLTIFKAI